MSSVRKLVIGLVIILFSHSSLALYSSNDQTQKALHFANSAIECGIFYQYMVRGMRNNPKVPGEMIRQVTDNSAMLINTADWLYGAAGISTKAKYDEVLLRAKKLVAQRNLGKDDMSDMIYDYGKKCQALLLDYDESVKEFLQPIDTY